MAIVIKDKNAGIEGLVTLTGENEVTIDWANDKADVLTVEDFHSLSESDDYEVEEIDEDMGDGQAQTDAMRSIQTHSSPDKENGGNGGQDDGNPKTRWDYMRSMLGGLATMDMNTLAQWNDQVLAQVGSGQFSAPTDGNCEGNKSSIDMKPSNAEGTTKNNQAPYMPGLGENVVLQLQKEEQDAVFGEAGLTEEAKMKVTTLFESVVAMRLSEEAIKLKDQFDKKLEESLTEITDKFVNALDEYMDFCVEKFMVENQVAIESSLRSELVMDFVDGLKGLFTEHYIDIPEDKVSVVEELAAENEALKEDLNEAANQEIENKKILISLQKQLDLANLSEGLTLVQKDKLRKATNETIYESAEDFAAKVKVIKEGLLGVAKESNILSEGISENTEDKVVSSDPALQFALSKMVKN